MSYSIPLPSERPTVPIWPEAGQALGYTNRSAAYRAAAKGYLPTVRLSANRYAVPTAKLRAMLGLDVNGGAA